MNEYGEGVVFEGVDVVGEDDDLVVAAFVVSDEELAGAEFVGIHDEEQHLFGRFAGQVFAVEFGAHRAPHLGALDARDEAALLQFQPVGLVQFRTDQKIQIRYFICSHTIIKKKRIE